MVLKLYKLDISPPVSAALMVCEIHKIPVEFIDTNLMEGDHLTPEFLKKNPLHTVPVLEDDDLILHDSHVIITYLTEKYGKDDSLYPKDIKKRALVDQKLFFDALLFSRSRNVTYPTFFEGLTKLTDAHLKPIEEVLGFLEAFLSTTKFVAGDSVTLADISICTTVATIRHYCPLDKFPKVQAWFSYMEKQPYFQKCAAPGSAVLGKLLKDKLNL